ncbi:unnamed protein product [Lactuca saligna]|uniref:Uncharacterized protein n=1 Tax=Lactuca saligna TaxID=75948 RepID=A0AA35Z6G6_LACSI|nr:unnamed protein product [Lactuca saligna]
MSDKVKKDEISLYHSVFASKTEEEIWNIGSGHVLHQGFTYHFKSNTILDWVPTYYIIYHVNRNGVVEDIYGINPVHVKKFLGNYLKIENYQKSTAFSKIKARVMKMTWKSDVVALNNLRIKYMANLMKSEYNKHKSMLEKDAKAYKRLDPLQILARMNEVKEIREKHKCGRRRF